MMNSMRHIISILFSLQLVSSPSLEGLETDWDSMQNKINESRSIVIDNTGIVHFYIGGANKDELIYFCSIHDIYEEVVINE